MTLTYFNIVKIEKSGRINSFYRIEEFGVVEDLVIEKRSKSGKDCSGIEGLDTLDIVAKDIL